MSVMEASTLVSMSLTICGVALSSGCVMSNPDFDERTFADATGAADQDDEDFSDTDGPMSEGATAGAGESSGTAGAEESSGTGAAADEMGGESGCEPEEISCGGECVLAGTPEHCELCEPCAGMCEDAECFEFEEHVVFVSSVAIGGSFGGLENADSTCASMAATSAYVPDGEHVAWLGAGDYTTAEEFDPGSVFIRPDDVVVAVGIEDLLDGVLEAPLTITEHDYPLEPGLCSPASMVWTGVTPEGEGVDFDCQGWTTSEAQGTVGSANATDGQWTLAESCNGGLQGCLDTARLYCISI